MKKLCSVSLHGVQCQENDVKILDKTFILIRYITRPFCIDRSHVPSSFRLKITEQHFYQTVAKKSNFWDFAPPPDLPGKSVNLAIFGLLLAEAGYGPV